MRWISVNCARRFRIYICLCLRSDLLRPRLLVLYQVKLFLRKNSLIGV